MVPEIGDKVLVNDEGKKMVVRTLKAGRCPPIMPEFLEGVVTEKGRYIVVRLPFYRRDVDNEMTDEWAFKENELN